MQEVRGRWNSRLNQQESASACLGWAWGAWRCYRAGPTGWKEDSPKVPTPSLTFFLLLAPGSSASLIIAHPNVSNPRNGECAASEAFVSVEGGGGGGGRGKGKGGGSAREGREGREGREWGGLPYVVTTIEPCGYRAREEGAIVVVPCGWPYQLLRQTHARAMGLLPLLAAGCLDLNLAFPH